MATISDTVRLSQAGLPAPVQALLDTARATADSALQPLGRAALAAFIDWQLFGETPHSEDTLARLRMSPRWQQAMCAAEEAVLPAFALQIESALARIRRSGPDTSATPHPAPRQPPRVLALVAIDTLDADGLVNEIACRMTTRSAGALHRLGQRMGVLAGSAALEPEHNPLGPKRLTQAWRQACSTLSPREEDIVRLLHLWDAQLRPASKTLFDTVDAALESAGLLPHLLHAGLPSAGIRPTGLSARPEPPTSATADRPTEDAQPADSPHRTAPPRPDPGAVHLDAALCQMQRTGRSGPLGWPDLHALLRQHTGHDQPPTQAALPKSALRAVDALCTQLDAAMHMSPQRPMQALQIPLIRALMLDPALLQQPQHPVQGLLAEMVRADCDWHDPGDPDSDALKVIHSAIHRIRSDYDGDSALFEQVRCDMHERLELLSRRAQLSERRHVEAARGQERLEIARLHVDELLERMMADAAMPALFRTLLEQGWRDVLVLTRLRHDEDAPRWREQIDITARLIARQGEMHDQGDAELCSVVTQALIDIGYEDASANGIAQQLAGPTLHPPDAEACQQAQRDLHTRQRPAAMAEPLPEKAAPGSRSEEAQAWHVKLSALPFGTWLELRDDEAHTWHRRRLAWYSHLTDKAVLVNLRGQRLPDTTLDQLARAFAEGTARLSQPADTASLVERMWDAARRAFRLGGAAPAQTRSAP